MALLTLLELDWIFSGYVIASFIVARKPIDVAVWGHLAFTNSFSCAFLSFVFVSFFLVFPFFVTVHSVYQSVLIGILFLLYFQGDVGPPGPPGPVSTIQWWKPTLHNIIHCQLLWDLISILSKGTTPCWMSNNKWL